MSIFNDLAKKLLDLLDTNNKQEQTDSISNYPNIPRLNGSLIELLPEIGMRSGLIIPATEMNIENESYSTFNERLEKETYPKYKRLAEEDFFVFSRERRKMIKNGFLYVSAERIKFSLVEVSECINDRGCGDDDGFGVEPDTFVKGYLNLDGEFVSAVALVESKTNTNIKNWLTMNINPIDSSGEIKKFPYDVVHKVYKIKGLFEVEKDFNVGLIDNKLNLIIPVQYKMIIVNKNNTVWIRLHNDLCGIVDLNNTIIIPAIYNYLSYIDKGQYKGLYKAELDGKAGVIDRNNSIVKPFEAINE